MILCAGASASACVHVRQRALPARQGPAPRHGPDGAHRPQARAPHL